LRDEILKKEGILVLRFTNNEARYSLDSVVREIESVIKNAHPHLISPSRREGEKTMGKGNLSVPKRGEA